MTKITGSLWYALKAGLIENNSLVYLYAELFTDEEKIDFSLLECGKTCCKKMFIVSILTRKLICATCKYAYSLSVDRSVKYTLIDGIKYITV